MLFNEVKAYFSSHKPNPAPLEVNEGMLVVNGQKIETHDNVREIGRGANGVVYSARNRLLKREEALKVWLKLRECDERDKVEQGLQEAMKLASVNGNNAVQIFTAQIIKGLVIATLEFVPAVTLNEYRKTCGMRELLISAHMYLEVIEKTSGKETFHGDPHLNNVLVLQGKDRFGETHLSLKLCDFGTSAFCGPERSEERHWAIVRDTVRKLTKSLPGSQYAWDLTKPLGAQSQALQKTMKERGDLFSDRELAGARLSGLKDYLDFWRHSLMQLG